MSTQHILIFGGITLAGLLQVALGMWMRDKTRSLLARGKRAPGRIVGAATLPNATGSGSSRHDVVAFTTEDGRELTANSRIGVPWSPHAGRSITVIYDPANPEDSVIDHWIELWAGAGIFLLNGGLMALLALVFGGLELSGVLTF